MTLAALYDTPYDIVYLLHIVSVIIGTGAAFALPVLAVKARNAGADARFVDEAVGTLMAPALLAAGVFGGALVGMSDDFYDFGQGWLAIGGLVWIVGVGAATLAYPPSFVSVPDMADKRPMLTGILHLSLAVMLVLMTFKWGSPLA